MTEFVVDASGLIVALTEQSEAAQALRDLLRSSICHAPHLIDAEVGNVLRRLVRAGEISEAYGSTALCAVGDAIDERHPHHGPIAEQAWRLRDNFTFYDALYVALASQLDVPLLTADHRLAKAPGLPCTVELV